MAIDSTVKHNLHFNVGFMKNLLQGIDAGKLTHQPRPGMNHPLWIVGHLAWTMEFPAKLLGVAYKAPDGWDKLFGMKSKPVDDAAKYPAITALLAELDRGIQVIGPALDSLSAEALAAEMPEEGFRQMMPTVGDGLTFILNSHIAMHTGQLSAWRRACGMPALF